MNILSIDIHPAYSHRFHDNPGLFKDWVLDASLASVIYLSGGKESGVEVGDMCQSIYRHVLRDGEGNEMAQRIEKDNNLLTIMEVQDRYAVAQITSFGYQLFFDRFLPQKVMEARPEVEFMELFPLAKGQECIPIPREEAREWQEIDRLYQQLSGNQHLIEADIRLYEEIIRLCDAFIKNQDLERSFFISDAFYQKGFALHKLKRFAASNEVFQQYLRFFPQGSSIQGARSWIAENNLYLHQPSTVKKTVILFLAANPESTSRLRLDHEIREIDKQLRLASMRDSVELVQKWAITPGELQQALLDHEPDFVHFSGHGVTEGIALEGKDGTHQLVNTAALGGMFRILAGKISCVLLNSCYSQHQAQEIAKHIPYVIGMSETVPDASSIAFSAGFYKGIGAGKKVEIAFELGKNSIELEGLNGSDLPVLLMR
ncbi:MAG: CHAT domain-containing protein [Bacteroidia bacterium]|nr:CHAT domain-containing protein [Bacteroidia bacterium]